VVNCGGAFRAGVFTTTVTPSAGKVIISFGQVVDQPLINAIELLPAP
jgi:hypothetical protein